MILNLECIRGDPKDKTDFNTGDVVGYKGAPTRLLFVGEDGKYMHTFNMETGCYYGIFKHPDNLGCLIRHETDNSRPKE